MSILARLSRGGKINLDRDASCNAMQTNIKTVFNAFKYGKSGKCWRGKCLKTYDSCDYLCGRLNYSVNDA